MSAMPEMLDFQSSYAPAPRRRRYQSSVRPERYLFTIAMTAIGVVALALWVGGFAQMTVTGYRVNRLQAELGRIQLTNRLLKEQEAALADPGRVSAAAAHLAMVKAAPAQTVFIGGARDAGDVLMPRPGGAIVAFAPEGGL